MRDKNNDFLGSYRKGAIQKLTAIFRIRRLNEVFWHYSWQERHERWSNHFFVNNIFPHQLQLFMLILGIALGLFVVGGGLISLTNALSRRDAGSRH